MSIMFAKLKQKTLEDKPGQKTAPQTAEEGKPTKVCFK